MAARVLIVDDDPVQRRLLDNMVRKFGHEPIVAESGDEAARLLRCGERFDCVVLDLVMPDLDGLGVLARLRADGNAIPVIVQTAHGGIDNVVSAMRAGAVDFVVKPVGTERLQVSLRNALEKSALEDELSRIKRSQSGTLTFKDIVTRSDRMYAVLRTAEKAATSTIPVLIEGESGVGKELVARAIHGQGERSAKPFVAVNCGAIPDNLVESILFGHEKGAFTGATERHTGKFVEASGGTLFLDEVGELPVAAQVKLLRALQQGEVEPVGARKAVKVDIRLISATNRNLIADVKNGRFREDLFYRLHVFPIAVPPLREHPEDIPELARHFLARIAAEEGKRIRSVSGEALALLGRHRWPGNVRQLENAVFRAVVLAEGDSVGIDEFPQIAAQVAAQVAAQSASQVTTHGANHGSNHGPNEGSSRGAIAPSFPDLPHTASAPAMVEVPSLLDVGPGVAPMGIGGLNLLDDHGDVRALEEIESETIRFAIAHYRGQMSEVARRLQIGRSTLYRKLEQLGLAERQASDQSEHAQKEPAEAD
jgi:DNA-binding NtrC family response regulator